MRVRVSVREIVRSVGTPGRAVSREGWGGPGGDERVKQPSRGIESSFSMALVCTTSRRILASAGTTHGPEKGDLFLL